MALERPAPAPSLAPPRLASAAGLASRSVADAPVEPYQPSAAPPAADPIVRPGDRSQWERIVLMPDVELHIRRPLPRAQNKQVDRLVTIARELLEEERS